MKLGIILNTNDPETGWNALRLGNEAIGAGQTVNIFLLGKGVELEKINDRTFKVAKVLQKFTDSGGKVMACGTCLTLRHQDAGVCEISTMASLVEMIADSDKVVTLG